MAEKLFFESIIRLIHDCRRIKVEPTAITLKSRHDGREFLMHLKMAATPANNIADPMTMAGWPLFTDIGDNRFGYVEVYGIKVMWPAERYPIRGEYGEPLRYEWLY